MTGQPLPNDPIGGATIGCAICLNLAGQHIPATTIINGYAVCTDCEPYLAGPHSDFGQVLRRITAHQDPV